MNKDERTELLRSKLTKTGRTERLWVKGAFDELEIWRAPTELLYLNDDNRRFRTEAQGVAAQLGRRLDPTANPDDELSITSLLLDREPWAIEGDRVVGRPSKDTIALLNDWESRGQEKPLWIRPDGLVTNGNRRLAMIKREQGIRGAEFGEWIEVIVFAEEDYDDDVLFDLEAREQLTEGFKKRYSDINVLLTLRDAADRESVDWTDPASVKRTATRIQHLVSAGEAYAEIQLYAIKYMDLFLEDIDQEGQYHLLQGMVERFREIGKTMKGVRDDDASREDAMLNVLFGAVQAEITNYDIRELRKLLKTDPDEFDTVVEDVRELEAEAENDEEDELPESEEGDDEDLDDDEAPSMRPPTAPHYPKRAVRRVLRLAVQGVRDAKEDDAVGEVQLAAQRLTNIDPEQLRPLLDKGATGKRLRESVAAIIRWAETAHGVLSGPDRK